MSVFRATFLFRHILCGIYQSLVFIAQLFPFSLYHVYDSFEFKELPKLTLDVFIFVIHANNIDVGFQVIRLLFKISLETLFHQSQSLAFFLTDIFASAFLFPDKNGLRLVSLSSSLSVSFSYSELSGSDDSDFFLLFELWILCLGIVVFLGVVLVL